MADTRPTEKISRNGNHKWRFRAHPQVEGVEWCTLDIGSAEGTTEEFRGYARQYLHAIHDLVEALHGTRNEDAARVAYSMAKDAVTELKRYAREGTPREREVADMFLNPKNYWNGN